MHLRLQLSAGDPHSALGDLSEGLSSLRALAPRTALPVPPPGTWVRPAARRQARRGKTLGPVLKAFVAAGPARRALLNVRSPCELGSFLLIFKRKKKNRCAIATQNWHRLPGALFSLRSVRL